MSPVANCGCSQDVLEPVLRRHAEALAPGSVRFNTELCDLRHEAGGLTGLLKDQVSGATSSFRARYVAAADGTRSFVREKLGIGRTGEKDIYDSVNVHFRADLRPWVEDRPAALYLIEQPELRATFLTVNGTAERLLERSAYLGSLDGRPSTYATLTAPRDQGGRFNRTRSVNQYLTHWIYPYQGKFHPQMIRALLNMLGVKAGERICEPYLGSGTTARHFVDLVGKRVAAGLEIRCVATSEATEAQAKALGIPLSSLDQLSELDLTVDGAAEIDPKLRLIKGGGGALLREKIVASASKRMVVIADSTIAGPAIAWDGASASKS